MTLFEMAFGITTCCLKRPTKQHVNTYQNEAQYNGIKELTISLKTVSIMTSTLYDEG
jgi:hypothetical protein